MSDRYAPSRMSVAITCAVVGLATIALDAEDWPQWRGVERDAVWRDTGLVERFADDGLIVKWRAPVRGGFAGPAVAGGRVFVMVVYDGPEASGSVQTHEFNDFVEELRFRGATAHAVLVSTRGGGLQTDVSVNITNNTGGIYKALAAATALPVTLTELATSMGAHYDEVKNRYRVIFECEPDNPQAQISLRVDRQAVDVRLFADRRPSP